MRRIIEGKRYDTASATLVAEARSGENCTDFAYFEETLYRTPSGAWFLYGEGGGLSKYREALSEHSWCGGSRITPLTPDEAMAWLEDHDETEALERHFAEAIQDA